MGEPIKYHGRTAVGVGGSLTFSYTHDPTKKPSKVGIITAALRSGTQTGSVSIQYGNGLTDTVEIENGSMTANSPSVTIHPNFVIYPGQYIRVVFSNVTAGDVAEAFIGGH